MRVSGKNNSPSSRTTASPGMERSKKGNRSSASDTTADFEKDVQLEIGWCRFNLRVLGLWPDPAVTEDGYFVKFLFLMPLAFVGLCVLVPQAINLIFIWGDIDLMTENLATASMPGVSCMSQIIATRYYKDALRSLVGCLIDDWKREITPRERSVMLEQAAFARRLSVFCTVLTHTMVTLFIIMRLMIVAPLEDRHSISEDHLPIYPCYFPLDLTQSPTLELLWTGQIIAAYLATTSFAGIDGCICTMVFHICGQFINLREALDAVFDNAKSAKDPDAVQAKLFEIVQRHQYLNWFAGRLEDCFNINLLIQMLVSVIQLCFQGLQVYQFVTIGNDDSVIIRLLFFVSFVSFYLLHIYLYCYIGEMLLVQSHEMGLSAYRSKWFNVSAMEARNVLLIMHRSVEPLRLTAGKFTTFSLQTFSVVLKTSFGYLSVLLTVMNPA